MKSIMHDKSERTCFLCMALHEDYSRKEILHEHHAVFGTANRALSERYGLKVYLCPYHHQISEEAVHKNQTLRRYVERRAQIAFIKRYQDLSFMQIFGKSFITEEEERAILHISKLRPRDVPPAAGIRHITDGVEGLPF